MKERNLTALEAAHHLGITAELIFQYTKDNFGKTTGLRSLRTVEYEGKTLFSIKELNDFDQLLKGFWCEPNTKPRPPIPKAIQDHLRAESQNQCARCGLGIGVQNAHITDWAISRSHYHHNLIRICSKCHIEHDNHQSLTTEELQKLKRKLIERTRARLKNVTDFTLPHLRPPRRAKYFFGREAELKSLTRSLQLAKSAMICGIGGIGKSELVLQAIHQVESERTLIWLKTDQYGTTEELLSALRTALIDDGVACSKEQLPSRLDAINACLVFDGVEQSSLDSWDEFEDVITQLHHDTHDTQFILTSQITLYQFPVDTIIQLKGLKKSACQLLFKEAKRGDISRDTKSDELLKFCDGHPLTILFAGALATYYGSDASALEAIEKNGTNSVKLPGRSKHNRRTSLELCLLTAYSTLPKSSRHLLWTLSQAPAGLFTNHIESFTHLENPKEALASLRQWHFVDVIQTLIDEDISNNKLLSPVRQFVINRAEKEEPESYEQIVDFITQHFGVMASVFEHHYNEPDDIPYVIQRYHYELPNFLNVLKLAKSREKNQKLVEMAITIAVSLMHYFFVLRITEQGSKVMFDAAELAIHSKNYRSAATLSMLFMSLASRSYDDSLIGKGLHLVKCVESSIDSSEDFPDLSMARALAAGMMGDDSAQEQYARKACEGYNAQLKVSKQNGNENADGIRNSISSALVMIGSSLLSQERYKESAEAYSKSIDYETGAQIGVNRGQTLHQIGNCESCLCNHKAAAELYYQAVEIFHFIGMKEYLSNAFSELGYTLLDVEYPETLNPLSEELVDSALLDLSIGTKHTFNPAKRLDEQQCSATIRKLFGATIHVSLSEYGKKLESFSLDLADATIVKLGEQINAGSRSKNDIFLVMMVNMILEIGVLVAQGDIDLNEKGHVRNETIGGILEIACEANEWAHETMRLTDWVSVYFIRRWGFKETIVNRLQEFIINYRDGNEDTLDLDVLFPDSSDASA